MPSKLRGRGKRFIFALSLVVAIKENNPACYYMDFTVNNLRLSVHINLQVYRRISPIYMHGQVSASCVEYSKVFLPKALHKCKTLEGNVVLLVLYCSAIFWFVGHYKANLNYHRTVETKDMVYENYYNSDNKTSPPRTQSLFDQKSFIGWKTWIMKFRNDSIAFVKLR